MLYFVESGKMLFSLFFSPLSESKSERKEGRRVKKRIATNSKNHISAQYQSTKLKINPSSP